MTTPSLHHSDYKVAWICALPLEMAAAKAMLEEVHGPLPQRSNDKNTYCLGKLSGHNVIIACLPSGVYGTTSAATVVSDMRSTFPKVEFGLMVGIGGGVPNTSADIRLGDVVVSMPSESSGGVIQYNFGKALPGGNFQRIGPLHSPPPQVLLTALSIVRSNDMLNGSKLGITIAAALDRNEYARGNFVRPDKDRLFVAEYTLENSGSDCSDCDERKLIPRTPRENFQEPGVHYGVIASGDQVIKDATKRDSLAQQSNILCFGMEAAGIMNQLPKDWQQWAALTAAAYATVLLAAIEGNVDSNQAKTSYNDRGSESQFNDHRGSHNNNTGTGHQFVGSNFSGTINFGSSS
ncbi:nucleoside phosphorylase domain-containing protein [Aspergillus avenaceus]|uniref:Nucleoside phosphorylase domain-containing protein n=1 Tax=Aspergillus avenaceus TaxID=36643 RepID=A0A5N6U7U9_ASPAV|nr:nucleoside phosphorylase domain-containing protein [Aspergillus avenaceus]